MIQASETAHLSDREVVLGVSGSVAAVETVRIARELRRHGAVVKPVATHSGLNFVGEQALEWACDEPVVRGLTGRAEHIELSDSDLLLVAPATANTVAKMAAGIADNVLTSLAAAMDPERIAVAPAMHLELYESDQFMENMDRLRKRGVSTVRPRVDGGAAKLPLVKDLAVFVKRFLREHDLPRKIVVTGGSTAEPLDDVRIVTTRSSGITGVELAREAYERGADVVLVYGQGTAVPPRWVRTVRAETAGEMTSGVMQELGDADALVCSAAISDHSGEPVEGKVPSDQPFQLSLQPVEKLVDRARDAYPELTIVSFKAESRMSDEELTKSGEEKLKEGSDLVVVNDVSRENAGFGSVENEVILVDGGSEKFRAPKSEIAELVMDRLA